MSAAPTAPEAPADNPLSQHFTTLSLLRFAFPTIFMMMFFGLYTVVDTMFIARFVNTNALSALNIVTPVINVIVGLGTMLAAGACAIVARKLGGGRDAEARQDFTAVMLAGAGIGLVIAATGLWCIDPMIRQLGASDLLFPYAKDYLRILLAFAPANMVQMIFTVFFVAAGRPGLGMAAGVAGGLANAVLDYAFMGPFGMGIAGAALATGIGYTVPAAVGVVFFLGNRRGALHFVRPVFRIRVLGESCGNGSSEMVGQLAAAVTTFFFNAAMMRLRGEDGIAAIAIIIYAHFLLITAYIGFFLGVSPVISYNHGSGNHQQLKQVCGICFRVIAVMSAAVFAATCVWGASLVGVFTPPGTAVYGMAVEGFMLFRFCFLLCGGNIFASTWFTALSNGLVSALISFSRTFLFLMAGLLLLPALFGVVGVWIAVPLAELATLILSLSLLLKYRGRYQY